MKHYITSLFITLAVLFGGSGVTVGQYSNVEDFSKATTLAGNAVYNSASFNGNQTTWTWSECQDGNKQSPKYIIEGTTPILRHPNSYIQSATISGGISNLKLDYKRAYTGTSASRIVEVYINNVLVGSGEECKNDANLRTLVVENLNIVGDFTVKIKIKGAGTTNAQTCIDNFSWNSLNNSSTPSLTPISAVNFGSQNVNTSASKNINIKGANLTGDLTVTVAGDGFTGSTTVTQADAEAGKDIAITFLPTVVGAATGTATISGGGLTSDVVVNLSGTALSVDPTLSPISTVDFGSIDVNTSTSKNINIKGANLTGDLTVTVAGDGFAGSTTVAQADAEAGKDIAITFLPTVVGAATGTATISGGGLTSDVVVNLSGTALSTDPTLNPIGAVDFGKVTIATTSSKNIVIEGRHLTDAITVTVAGDGFTGSTTVAASEAMTAGGKTVIIDFHPTEVGIVNGTVTISGGGLTADVVVDLSGEGKEAPQFMIENFEHSSWLGTGSTSYTLRTITDELGEWSVSGVTTMDANDRRNGTNSIRLRGNTGDNCKVEMKFDKPNGLGTLSFLYASYSTHDGGTITAYYSTDSGASWTIIGSVDPVKWVDKPYMELVTFAVNITGNARIKIARDGVLGSSTSVNIDDIEMTNYTDPTSITPTQGAAFKVISQADGIVIDQIKAGETIRVYNVSGNEIVKQIAGSSRQMIALGKGLYIIQVGNTTTKVVR